MEENNSQYAGRWIAKLRDDIVGHGGTPEQANQAAKASRYKETPEISFVPMSTPLKFSPTIKEIFSTFPQDVPIYLVGGAVRDMMLDLPVHDYDFVLPKNAFEIGRNIANRINAAYYPLDKERGTARAILSSEYGDRYVLDFAEYRGFELENDLRARDFTINAMALNTRPPHELHDPLGGIFDLSQKRLRVCSPTSMVDDPVRILRAIRMAANFGFHIDANTRQLMRSALPGLSKISPERQRDEILSILGGKQPHVSIQALEILGALPYVFPELPALDGISQSPPHIKDVWHHTIDTIRMLDDVTYLLTTLPDPNKSGNFNKGLLSLRVGRYREQIRTHLSNEPITDRTVKSLLFLAALYHDAAKPQTQSTEENGRIRFFNHDQLGAQIIAKRSKFFRLSNTETDRLATIVRHHMRPSFLSHIEGGLTRRAIYRFFRDTSEAGVDICLLSLADVLATYGPGLPQERWEKQIDTVRTLLEAWWEQPEEQINPPALISGHELINHFDLKPGPMLGEIIEMIREAQVAKEISSREEALDFTKRYMDNRKSG